MALCGARSRVFPRAALQASLALAPTPRAALWLARADLAMTVTRADAMPGLAARLPLACLQWPEDTVATLAGLGLRNVADLSGCHAPASPRVSARSCSMNSTRVSAGAPCRAGVTSCRSVSTSGSNLPAAAELVAGLQPAIECLLASARRLPARPCVGRQRLAPGSPAPRRRRRHGSASRSPRMAGDAAHLRELVRRTARRSAGSPRRSRRSGCVPECCCRSCFATPDSSSAAGARIRRRRRACSISCARGSGSRRCSASRRCPSIAPSAPSGSRSRAARTALPLPWTGRAPGASVVDARRAAAAR